MKPGRILRPHVLSENYESLEIHAKSKLHAAECPVAKPAPVESEASQGQSVAKRAVVIRPGVKACGVRHVVDLPGEFHLRSLAKIPTLVKGGIDVEDAVRAEVIALARLTGIGQSDRRAGLHAALNRLVVCENLRQGVFDVFVDLHRSEEHTKCLHLPARCPPGFEDPERQSARPAT